MKLLDYSKNTLWAFTEKGIQAVYGIVFAVYVLRALPSEESALYIILQGIFLSFSNILQGLALNPMVKYFSEDNSRNKILFASFFINFTAFGIGSALLFASKTYLSSVLKLPTFDETLYLALLVTFCFSLKNFICEVYRAKNLIWIYSLINIIFLVFCIVLLTILGLSDKISNAVQVVWINIFGLLASLVFAFCIFLKRKSLAILKSFAFTFWDEVKTLLNFGKFTASALTFHQIYERIDIFMIAALLGDKEVAVYYAVINFKKVYELIKQVVSIVFFPTFSKLWYERKLVELKKIFEKVVFTSFVVNLLVSLVLLVFANEIFTLIYGGKFPEGIVLLKFFVIYGIVLPWSLASELVLIAIEKPKFVLIVRIVSGILNIVLNYFLIINFGIAGSIFATLLSTFYLGFAYTKKSKEIIDFTLVGIFSRYKDYLNLAKNKV